ncbi:MAG: hypothetical protein JXK95_00475 [Bacteroidales bacterium]|nr:hypothetical protein [Bacteroidales bacterium]
MKKMNFLRTVMSIAAAMLVTTGVFGQVEVADYQPISGDVTAEIDSVTTGTTTRLYVKPDAYYHPNYTAVGSWALTGGFTWTWNVPVAAGTPQGELTDDVWVEVLWGAADPANYNVVVTETSPAAYGGCSGDTNVYVRILAEPTVTFTADNPGSIIGADLTVCEGDARLTDIVQATLTGITNLQMLWTLEIATLNASAAKDEYFDLDKLTLGAVQDFAIERAGTVADPQESGINALTFDFDRPNDGDYTAIDPGSGTKKATLYTYVINGVNDRISRKSDYLSNPTAAAQSWTYYDTVAETIVIRVNPAPVTGPIYHIPNNWNN